MYFDFLRCRTPQGTHMDAFKPLGVFWTKFINLVPHRGSWISPLIRRAEILLKAIHFVRKECLHDLQFMKTRSSSPNLSKLARAVSLWRQDPCAKLLTKRMDFMAWTAGLVRIMYKFCVLFELVEVWDFGPGLYSIDVVHIISVSDISWHKTKSANAADVI